MERRRSDDVSTITTNLAKRFVVCVEKREGPDPIA
jgi:hypothetical protein